MREIYVMINVISKYLAGELTPGKTELFLSEINKDKNLKKEFIEVQQLVAYTGLLSGKSDEENAREPLLHFMQRVKKNKD